MGDCPCGVRLRLAPGPSSRRRSQRWFTELTGHHASLLLAFAILYEHYCFAFADISLKRAVSLLALVTVALGLYFTVGPTILAGCTWNDPRVFGSLLGLWVSMALSYPALRRALNWFVDAVVLSRPNYSNLKMKVAGLLTQHETEEAVTRNNQQLPSSRLQSRVLRDSLHRL